MSPCTLEMVHGTVLSPPSAERPAAESWQRQDKGDSAMTTVEKRDSWVEEVGRAGCGFGRQIQVYTKAGKFKTLKV